MLRDMEIWDVRDNGANVGEDWADPGRDKVRRPSGLGLAQGGTGPGKMCYLIPALSEGIWAIIHNTAKVLGPARGGADYGQ